jgi:hypothetical protein
MVRVIVAVALAAAVQFAWGFAFFGFLGGFDYMTSRAADETAVAAALQKDLPESGTYFLPMCPGMSASEEETKAFEKRHASGPIVQIHYRKEGMSLAQMPLMMGMGFGHTLLTALLAAFLLRMALPGLPCYRNRVGFVLGLGVFAAVATRLSDAIWLYQPWAFPLGQMVFCVTAWLLAGAIMGAIIRPSRMQTQALQPHHPSTSAA